MLIQEDTGSITADFTKPFVCLECRRTATSRFPAVWMIPKEPQPIKDDPAGSRRWRALLYSKCSTNPSLRAAEMIRCAQSVVYWVNNYVWTCDQRSSVDMRDMPFDLFAIQMEFLNWIKELHVRAESYKHKGRDFSITGLCEKSRGQGATWLAVAYGVHGWLFSRGFAVGYGSLKREEVDEIGNMNTILEKARYIIRHLPSWMMPENYNEIKDATHCKILNRTNGAAMVGEGGENMGRGGKTSIFFVDESAHLLNSKAVDKALAETSNCKIHISTPKGAAGGFYEKIQSGNFPTFRMHWRDDPRKDDAWAEAKKKELNDPVAWAEEYEIDYHASVEGVCIPNLWVQAAVGLMLPEFEGPKVAGLDCSGEGANQTVLISRRGPNTDVPVSWSGLDTTQSAHKAADEACKMNVAELYYDVSGLGIGYKSAWKAMEVPLTLKTHGINSGLPPTDRKWPNGKISKELFVNQKAEFWWMLRSRFEKSYEYRHGLAEHPADEMISIPNHPQLISELSKPLYFHRETGKIVMESKKEMRSRGVKSPDFADALVLAFAPRPKLKRAMWW